MTNQSEYFAVTNKLYQLKQANEWDYAVMAAISTFNYPFVTDDEKTTEIKIKPFKIDDVFNVLNMSNKSRNKKVIKNKIQQSLTKLLKEKVLLLTEVVKCEGRENTFILKQNIDTSGKYTGFASITADEFFNITLKIEKDGDKIKALACYTSIVQRIFKSAKREKQANFNWESTISYYINWELQETIGAKYGMSRKAVGKSIDLLAEVEAIAVKAVKQKNSGKEVKYIYAKACDSDMLDLYVHEQIEKGDYIKVLNKKVKTNDIETETKTETTNETQTVDLLDQLIEIEAEAEIETTKSEEKEKLINIDKYKKIEELASFKLSNSVSAEADSISELFEEEDNEKIDLLADIRKMIK